MDMDFSKDLVLQHRRDPEKKLKICIRSLRNQEDYDRFIELERVTWGQDFAECVPASMLMINQKVGGLSGGAFTETGEMVGLIYGLTGYKQGHVSHWSHMMAVSESLRDMGLGKQLKLFQRDFVLKMGVTEVLWTYDPLESRNAHLNMNHLGGFPEEYTRNVYGEGDTSGLHAGIGTDRFTIYWRVNTAHVEQVLKQPQPLDSDDWRDARVVNTSKGRPDENLPLVDEPRIKVEVPYDIQVAKNAEAGLGKRWRMCTRRAFEHYMSQGWRVTRFFREDGRCYYGMTK